MSLGKKRASRSTAFEGQHKPSTGPRIALLAGGALAAHAVGCGMLVDTDREQCKVATDCAELLGGAPSDYTCTQNLCLSNAQCTANEQCTVPGKPICAAGACVECVINTDCGSEIATCVDSVCQYPGWTCIDEADNRPSFTQPSATLKIAGVDAIYQTQGVPGTTVKTCLPPTIDPDCTIPVAGSTATYDTPTGMGTFTGIMTNSIPQVRFDAPEGMQDVAYTTNRPVRDVETPASAPIVLRTIVDMFDKPYKLDFAKSILNLRVYDCDGKLAEGVSVKVSSLPADGMISYSDPFGLPNFTRTATSAAGVIGILNGVVGSLTIDLSFGPKPVISFTTVVRGERTTYIDLYPRRFSM